MTDKSFKHRFNVDPDYALKLLQEKEAELTNKLTFALKQLPNKNLEKAIVSFQNAITVYRSLQTIIKEEFQIE